TYAMNNGFLRFICEKFGLEQMTIATQLSFSQDPKDFADWRGGDERIKFGWACDFLQKNAVVAGLELQLKTTTKDTLFDQTPKGLARRFFRLVSKYTHGTSGFATETRGKATGRSSCPKPSLNGVLQL